MFTGPPVPLGENSIFINAMRVNNLPNNNNGPFRLVSFFYAFCMARVNNSLYSFTLNYNNFLPKTNFDFHRPRYYNSVYTYENRLRFVGDVLSWELSRVLICQTPFQIRSLF